MSEIRTCVCIADTHCTELKFNIWFHLCSCTISSSQFKINKINKFSKPRTYFLAEKWPKTASGLPSTAGTTASIAFIRRGKIFIGHVGDSAIVLGVQHPENPHAWTPMPLTRDHKPESLEESRRIQQVGKFNCCSLGKLWFERTKPQSVFHDIIIFFTSRDGVLGA